MASGKIGRTDGQPNHWWCTNNGQMIDGRKADRQSKLEVVRRLSIDSDLSPFYKLSFARIDWSLLQNDFYKLNCLFLKHHNEVNKKIKLCRIYIVLVMCTNDTMRWLCRFLHTSRMSLMSLVNDRAFCPKWYFWVMKQCLLICKNLIIWKCLTSPNKLKVS